MKIDDVTKLAISRCLTPITVNTPYGIETVPCGKCRFCRSQRLGRYSSLIKNELTGIQSIFFTLTYDRFHLPKVYLTYSDDNGTCEPYLTAQPHIYYQEKICTNNLERRKKDFKPQYKIVTYRKKQFHNLHSIDPEIYSNYAKYNSKDISKNQVAVILVRDVQNFLKRLRKVIYKYFKEEFRFYALLEYGGRRFRPHYHIILFGPNASKYLRFVNDKWKKGNVDHSGSVNGTDQLTKYLSNYVSDVSSIPNFLSQISPQKVLHSKYLGVNFLRSFTKDIYTNPDLLSQKTITVYQYTPLNSNISTLSFKSLLPPTSYFKNSSVHYDNSGIPIYTAYHNHSTTKYKVTSTTYNYNFTQDVINYFFPTLWGEKRENLISDKFILHSYKYFQCPKTPLHYIQSILYCYPVYPYFGLYDNYSSHLGSNTPLKLQLPITSKINNFFSLLDENVHYQNIRFKFYQYCQETFKKSKKEYYSLLDTVLTIYSRLTQCYYISKHFYYNLSPYISINEYVKAKESLFNKLQQNKLHDYFSLLEQNSLYPYEYFIKNPVKVISKEIENDLIPLQTEYLKSFTKHKEINNRNESLFS